MDIFARELNKIKYSTGLTVSKQLATESINCIKEELRKEGKITIIKFLTVPFVRKYDVLSVRVGGIPHPAIVYKVEGDLVHVVSLSTTEAPHNIYRMTGSRFYGDNWMTNTMFVVTMKEAVNSFMNMHDNKSEASKGFKALKEHYRKVFRLKI